MDPLLSQFYRQYLQQVQSLSYPPSKLLALPDVQQQLFRYFFDERTDPFLPPYEYQRKVLKRVVAEILKEVGDEDDEVSDDLMVHMGYLSSLPKHSDFELAQERRVLSYFIPDTPQPAPNVSTFDVPNANNVNSASVISRILIRESPQLLAAGSNVGHRTWEASLRLAYYLCTSQERSSMADANVLELGAGTGLLSLICSLNLGTCNVIATDGLSQVVDGIEENVALNNKHSASQQEALKTPLARMLDWTDLSNLEDVLSIDGGRLKFDYMLGADITYHPELLSPLASLISMLKDLYTGCRVLISATVRNENTLRLWYQSCQSHGLKIREVNEEDDHWQCPQYRLQTGLFHEQAFPIVIMDITK